VHLFLRNFKKPPFSPSIWIFDEEFRLWDSLQKYAKATPARFKKEKLSSPFCELVLFVRSCKIYIYSTSKTSQDVYTLIFSNIHQEAQVLLLIRYCILKKKIENTRATCLFTVHVRNVDYPWHVVDVLQHWWTYDVVVGDGPHGQGDPHEEEDGEGGGGPKRGKRAQPIPPKIIFY
jgi:hypothetical protein